ncbi:MAG: GPR endopeptidase [Bacilli bacterium]|nr:GPR endopeptidase [Bacilli bacterium]MDD4298517.1 GPR endopeptidase [Bacilli bacterium]MDD4643857.1 GPR endopeptidase [Bacilli bacterium]
MRDIDLNKYQLRTDLAIEAIEGIDVKDGIVTKEVVKDDVKITMVDVLEDGIKLINKKKGRYITIEFDDPVDSDRQEAIKRIFGEQLKEFLSFLKIKDDANCLVIGLGNDKSTPDSLGPSVIDNVVVTKHLFALGSVSDGYRNVSAISPGVMGQTGIETSEIIFGITKRVKPDFIIIIDALASSSLSRINKTIQMTDTGIHPGSGVGNARKEISYELLKVPVIAIGIPTVVDAVTIVSDTINFMQKQMAYNKENINNPIHKLITPSMIDYRKPQHDLSATEKKNLMGIIGTLEESEMKQLIYEVLSPIGYNLMVTPKEIDFIIEKLSDIVAEGINSALHRNKFKL